MKLARISAENRAVSPVVGTVLLLGVTVTMAAVSGALVVGVVVDTGTDPPETTFDVEYDGGSDYDVTIVHRSGERIERNLTVIYDDGARRSWTGSAADPIEVGDSVTVSGVDPGSTVRVVWHAETGTRSATLSLSEAPSG